MWFMQRDGKTSRSWLRDGEEKVNLESVLVSLFKPYESLNVGFSLAVKVFKYQTIVI